MGMVKRTRFIETKRNPSASIRSKIFPIRLRSTASGLIMAKVCSMMGFFVSSKRLNKIKKGT